jgi:hypothetical protein
MAADSVKFGTLFRPNIRNGGYKHSPHFATAHTAKRYRQEVMRPGRYTEFFDIFVL